MAYVESAFPIETYEIVFVDGTFVAKTKATSYRFPAPSRDMGLSSPSDRRSGECIWVGEAAYLVTKPEPPQVTAVLDGEGITVRWKATTSLLPIVAWDLVRQWEETRMMADRYQRGRLWTS